ncbi:MAG: carbohydrate ABC transporter permease [Acidimicrobiales bacterium]
MVSAPRSHAVLRHLPAACIAVGGCLPLILMVAGSLQHPGEPPSRVVDIVPSHPSIEGYRRAFELVDLGRYFINSLVVVAIAVPLSVVCASWAGFALSQLPRRPARLVLGLCVLILVLPPAALVVGRFALYRRLGILDTYVPLVAPSLYGTSVLYVLLYAWSFRRLPSAYLDVGRLAGLGPFQLWRSIAFPLVRPMTVAVATLAFVTTWSNFLDPLVYLQDPALYTLPLGLRVLKLVGQQDVPVQLAASVVTTLPVVGAFLSAQRFFLGTVRGRGWIAG